MKVLIIPEDVPNDQHILKPLFERLLASLGRRRAKVRVSQERLRGVGQALNVDRIAEIVDRYRGEVRVIVLCVDRDGKDGKDGRENRILRLANIEREIESRFGDGLDFLAADAWEEIEAWVLAGLDLPGDWRWIDVRAEVHVKERYFDRLAESLGLAEEQGGGRERLGKIAARRIDAIRRKCPEDFGNLARRLETIIQGN